MTVASGDAVGSVAVCEIDADYGERSAIENFKMRLECQADRVLNEGSRRQPLCYYRPLGGGDEGPGAREILYWYDLRGNRCTFWYYCSIVYMSMSISKRAHDR